MGDTGHAVAQFVTGTFTPQHVFLPDEDYSRALDALVKAVSDVLITDAFGTRVFLGKRKVHPLQDWWCIGGRARPGECPRLAAARNVRRELRLDINPARFQPVAHYSFLWSMRAQAPAENGTADTCTMHWLRVTDDEAAAAVHDLDEYSEVQWHTVENVLAGDNFHPALKQALLDMRRAAKYEALRAAVSSNDADARIASAAREFFAATEARDAAVAGGIVHADLQLNGTYKVRHASVQTMGTEVKTAET